MELKKQSTDIETVMEKQRAFFTTGKTIDLDFRLQALKRLYRCISEHETEIAAALTQDLGKSDYESYMCEVGLSLAELSHQIKHLKRFAKPQRVKTPLVQFHARSFTIAEPYGLVLIMSPWNYPFMLAMEPLFGALAAGNCCVLKPSAYSPATSALIRGMMRDLFPEEYVAVVEGGRAENQALLEQRFDYIFFTGSVGVGKEVMAKASAHLTPVTLELGGKSPCIVDETANLAVAAKRIVFGKFLNCGQTCVAPDYVLVQANKKEALVKLLCAEICRTYGENALENPHFGKIINQKHTERLIGLMENERILFGGQYDKDAQKIAPTLLDRPVLEAPVMQEEIFGPILPILTFSSIEEAERIIHSYEKPLALYLFSNSKRTQDRFLRYMPFGGGCLNDTIVHIASSEMPFGGVGYSGMGQYHGKDSFRTFSHQKSILKRDNWIDLPVRYQPYRPSYKTLLKRLLK